MSNISNFSFSVQSFVMFATLSSNAFVRILVHTNYDTHNTYFIVHTTKIFFPDVSSTWYLYHVSRDALVLAVAQ